MNLEFPFMVKFRRAVSGRRSARRNVSGFSFGLPFVTLLQLRDRCKQESDNVGSSFLTDPEWNSLINSSYQELYGLLIQVYGNDYYVQSTPFTITTDGINTLFALPPDFFKLLGVDLLINAGISSYVSLKPFSFADRNQGWVGRGNIPAAGQTVRLLYIPWLTALVLDADTFNYVNGWEEYIVIDACIKALTKEESDVSVFMARKQAMIARLEAEAENRDAGNPATVVDTRGRRAMGMMYRLNGNNLWLMGNGAPGWAFDGFNGDYW